MATGSHTPTTADKHIPDVWTNEILRSEEFACVIQQTVNRDWKFAGHGDVYHVRRLPNIESTTLTVGTDWTPYVYTDTEQTLTINVFDITGILVNDVTKALSMTDFEAEATRQIGYSLNRSIEVNLAALFQSFSQIVGTYGGELTWDNYLRIAQYLADAGVQDRGYSWLISPAAEMAAMKLDMFVNSLYRGDKGPKAIDQGMISKDLLGGRVIRSNLLRSPASGQHDCAAYVRDAIAIIKALEPKVFNEFQALRPGTVIGALSVYGYTEVDRYSETPGNITATDEWCVLAKTV